MHCPSCGNANVKGAKYCSACGKRLRIKSSPTFFKVFSLITVTVNFIAVILLGALIFIVFAFITGNGESAGPIGSENPEHPLGSNGSYDRTAEFEASPAFTESAVTPIPTVAPEYASEPASASIQNDEEPLYALKDFILTGDADIADQILPPGYFDGIDLPFPFEGADKVLIRELMVGKLRRTYGEFDNAELIVTARKKLTEDELADIVERLGDTHIDDCRKLDVKLTLSCEDEKKSFHLAVTVLFTDGSWYIDPASLGL